MSKYVTSAYGEALFRLMEEKNIEKITVDELCEVLMIGKNAAYHLLQSGKIKCFRIGRIWKIPRESLNKYIREQSYLLS